MGGNVFGWTVDETTAFNILDAFVAAGCNLIDTADTYSRWVPGNKGGESETIIGKWLKRSGNRGKVVIATKVGSEMGPNNKGLSKAYILRAVEDSLKRLQTDHIDLYQSHKDDPNHSPGRNAGGLCAIGQGGKSQGNRRIELHCRTPFRSVADQRTTGIPCVSESAAPV